MPHTERDIVVFQCEMLLLLGALLAAIYALWLHLFNITWCDKGVGEHFSPRDDLLIEHLPELLDQAAPLDRFDRELPATVIPEAEGLFDVVGRQARPPCPRREDLAGAADARLIACRTSGRIPAPSRRSAAVPPPAVARPSPPARRPLSSGTARAAPSKL